MFYTYVQNNSGRYFIRNNDVARYVIIEADSPDMADSKAEEIGIYFNGVDKEMDCPCCGDRWNTAYQKGTDIPKIYDVLANEYVIQEDRIRWESPGDPVVHIYYADGRKETLI